MIPRHAPMVALVGIDGSGKSTTLGLLAERFGPQCAVVSSLRNHEIPDAPLHELSRALERLGRVAHELGSPGLKLTTLYLQMCMYGPTVGFVNHALAPSILLSDRHPVLDASVYLPLFGEMIARTEEVPDAERWLAGVSASERETVLRWVAAQARRSGRSFELPALVHELMTLTAVAPGLNQLQAVLRTPLPEVAVWLDIEVDAAVERISNRDKPREAHETAQRLYAARAGYERLYAQIAPNSLVHRVGIDGMSQHEVVDSIADFLGKVGVNVRAERVAA